MDKDSTQIYTRTFRRKKRTRTMFCSVERQPVCVRWTGWIGRRPSYLLGRSMHHSGPELRYRMRRVSIKSRRSQTSLQEWDRIWSRARKVRAHSRILRLEREILRPENLVQSQLLVRRPKLQKVLRSEVTLPPSVNKTIDSRLDRGKHFESNCTCWQSQTAADCESIRLRFFVDRSRLCVPIVTT